MQAKRRGKNPPTKLESARRYIWRRLELGDSPYGLEPWEFVALGSVCRDIGRHNLADFGDHWVAPNAPDGIKSNF